MCIAAQFTLHVTYRPATISWYNEQKTKGNNSYSKYEADFENINGYRGWIRGVLSGTSIHSPRVVNHT